MGLMSYLSQQEKATAGLASKRLQDNSRESLLHQEEITFNEENDNIQGLLNYLEQRAQKTNKPLSLKMINIKPDQLIKIKSFLGSIAGLSLSFSSRDFLPIIGTIRVWMERRELSHLEKLEIIQTQWNTLEWIGNGSDYGIPLKTFVEKLPHLKHLKLQGFASGESEIIGINLDKLQTSSSLQALDLSMNRLGIDAVNKIFKSNRFPPTCFY